MNLVALTTAVRLQHLDIFGALHAQKGGTILLLGPREPGFWQNFTLSPEYSDGLPDPLDRWSKRVISDLAREAGGHAVFPSDGPPYPPFLGWAEKSGRAWSSPVGLLVHDIAGLWLSFRGAIHLSEEIDLPKPPPNPCLTCQDQPCIDAYPVGAMKNGSYDVPNCHDWLDKSSGAGCMGKGCAVRRACPISTTYGRIEAQSAFHMKAFHPK